MVRDELPGAAVVEIVAVDRGDDDMVEAELRRPPRRHARGSCGSSWSGLPVATLQKAQARVQTSPRIITVACFCFQHSPIFGQAASSHTVLSFSSRIRSRVSRYSGEFGALTRIQSRLARRRIVGPVRLLGMTQRRPCRAHAHLDVERAGRRRQAPTRASFPTGSDAGRWSPSARARCVSSVLAMA